MNIDIAQSIFDAINIHTLPGEGITRPSYSYTESAAMAVVQKYAESYGLSTEVDNVGNLHCTIQGSFAEEGENITGSHLDSVAHGGKYDGVAGVVAGLLVLKELSESGVKKRPRLIVFRGEESAWFGKCYLGSLGLFGLLTNEDMARTSAHDGVTLRRTISRYWGDGAFLSNGVPAPSRCIDFWSPQNSRFIEVHIEQGPVLHGAGERIGIVKSIRGNCRYRRANIMGAAGHSGTTPTRMRQDALLAFVDVLYQLERGAQVFGDELVMTCGVAGTDPEIHGPTTIPEVIRFDLEFRSSKPGVVSCFEEFYLETLARVCRQRGMTSHDAGLRTLTEPVQLDAITHHDLSRIAHRVLDTEDVMHLPSGAGHDAAVFQQAGIPTGMIFIRNDHGSHNPRESMQIKDFCIATRVLYYAMGGK